MCKSRFFNDVSLSINYLSLKGFPWGLVGGVVWEAEAFRERSETNVNFGVVRLIVAGEWSNMEVWN